MDPGHCLPQLFHETTNLVVTVAASAERALGVERSGKKYGGSNYFDISPLHVRGLFVGIDSCLGN